MGSGYYGGFGATKGARENDLSKGDQSEASLIGELKRRNIKFNQKDIVFIVKDKTGQIVWLETGNKLAGLKHILYTGNKGKGHADDFLKLAGVTIEEIPNYLKNVFSKGNVIKDRLVYRHGRYGREKIYEYQNDQIIIDGFIVSAYPVPREKK